jgi:hypothetical protein
MGKVNGKASFHFKNASRMEFSSITPISFFVVYKREEARGIEYMVGATGGNGIFSGGSSGGVTGFGYASANSIRVQNTTENFNQNQSTYIGDTLKKVWSNGTDEATASSTSYSEYETIHNQNRQRNIPCNSQRGMAGTGQSA